MIVLFGGAAFDTTPISPVYWAISIAFGAGSLVVGALVRLIPDAPIGQLLIKLRIMPDIDTLPRMRPSKKGSESEDEKMDGKPFRCECRANLQPSASTDPGDCQSFKLYVVEDTRQIAACISCFTRRLRGRATRKL